MIVYNVTVKVDPDVSEQWVRWIKEEHGQEVVDTGCFEKYELYQILDNLENEEDRVYAVKYYTQDLENYQRYENEYADAMRQKGKEAFGNKFVAFRTLMKSI